MGFPPKHKIHANPIINKSDENIIYKNRLLYSDFTRGGVFPFTKKKKKNSLRDKGFDLNRNREILPAVVGEFAIGWKIYIIQFVGINYTIQLHLLTLFSIRRR